MTNSEKCSEAVRFLNVLVPHITEFEVSGVSLNLQSPESPLPLETKVCSQCKELLPLADFGIGTRRPDGLNVYCKQCNRDKTNAGREVRKVKDRAQSKARFERLQAAEQCRERIRLNDLSGAVEDALRGKALGFRSLKRAVGMGEDALCDILAELWDAGRVRIERVDEERVYSLK